VICGKCQELCSLVPPAARLVGIEPNPGPQKRKVNNKKKSRKQTTSKDVALAFAVDGALPSANNYSSSNQVFDVSQSTETVLALASSTSIPTFSAASFQLTDIGQYNSWTNIFDQYRIREIEVWLVPQQSETTANTSMGLMTSVIDYDDATALTTIANALDFENALTTSGMAGHYRRFVPHVAMAAYAGAFTSFANVSSPWIDAASPTVPHYGLKTAWTPTTSAQNYSLIARYHLQFRNVR